MTEQSMRADDNSVKSDVLLPLDFTDSENHSREPAEQSTPTNHAAEESDVVHATEAAESPAEPPFNFVSSVKRIYEPVNEATPEQKAWKSYARSHDPDGNEIDFGNLSTDLQDKLAKDFGREVPKNLAKIDRQLWAINIQTRLKNDWAVMDPDSEITLGHPAIGM